MINPIQLFATANGEIGIRLQREIPRSPTKAHASFETIEINLSKHLEDILRRALISPSPSSPQDKGPESSA